MAWSLDDLVDVGGVVVVVDERVVERVVDLVGVARLELPDEVEEPLAEGPLAVDEAPFGFIEIKPFPIIFTDIYSLLLLANIYKYTLLLTWTNIYILNYCFSSLSLFFVTSEKYEVFWIYKFSCTIIDGHNTVACSCTCNCRK